MRIATTKVIFIAMTMDSIQFSKCLSVCIKQKQFVQSKTGIVAC